MSQAIKKAVQNVMLMPRKNKYEKDYRSLLKEYEENRLKLLDYLNSEEVKKETKEKVCILTYDELKKNGLDYSYDSNRFYILYDCSFGILKEECERLVFEFVNCHPEALLVYGDEDYFVLSGEYDSKEDARIPHSFRYFKPGFSPETLASFNYLGVFAARGDILSKALLNVNAKEDFDVFLYSLGIEICSLLKKEKNEKAIKHIPAVILSNPVAVSDDEYAGVLKSRRSDECVSKYLKNSELSGSSTKFEKTRKEAVQKMGLELPEITPSVSVIIPSKDNPDMLISCIERMKLQTKDNLQLLIVDNGSSEENRKKIEEYLNAYKGNCRYIYDVFDFNYSKMNNMAVREATGEVLLLLNDDIEADGSDWIDLLAKTATIEGVGCAGCKLLYPDGNIQHVGIAGGVDGPAHIFMGEPDDERLGFGDNRVNRNVLAVTGACLAVRKKLYEEAGGLFEDLKVGYNDVDLCMNLYEKGYRNVLINGIKLIHHESVTRGKDAKSKEKSLRLMNEKNILKKRHGELMISDPYVSAKEDFKLSFERENDNTEVSQNVKEGTRKANDDEGWIYSSFEKLEVIVEDGRRVLSVKGYSLVPGIDNMRFDFDMILEKDSKQYLIPVGRKLRTDLFDRFKGSENTHLCGMDFKEDISILPAGTYEVKMYAKDHGNVREIITDTAQRITLPDR